MKTPNIVLLHAHDAGRWIQPYGFAVETPNLMRFAKSGVLFRKAFSVSPTCGPARSAMMTGMYPHQIGVLGLPGPDGWRINDYGKHIVNLLNKEGYQTALAGCQHEVESEDLSPLGYQRILNDPRRERPGQFYSETIDKVEEFLAEDHSERPFFLSVGLDEPHRNNIARPEIGIGRESARFSKTRYYDPERLDWRYTAPPPWLPDLPEIRKDTESLNQGVRIMDQYMGRVLDALEHHGFSENTLIIVTTDHGIEFPGGKKTLRDGGLGVMLMIQGPDGFHGGKVVEGMVSHLDIYSTILDYSGVSQPSWIEGQSLKPDTDGKFPTHSILYSEQTYHGGVEAFRGIRNERYKFILCHEEKGPRMRHDGPSTKVMENFGHYEQERGKELLFDLYLDPQECNDLSKDPAHRQILSELRSSLISHLERTGDFFLSGEIPPRPRDMMS